MGTRLPYPANYPLYREWPTDDCQREGQPDVRSMRDHIPGSSIPGKHGPLLQQGVLVRSKTP